MCTVAMTKIYIYILLYVALICAGGITAINVHQQNGSVIVVSDIAIQEMRIQASFMHSVSDALRYTEGMFLTIRRIDGAEFFRSLSRGNHKTPTVPEPQKYADRYKQVTFSMVLLPHTILIYKTPYKIWVHVAGDRTNVISPVSLGNREYGTWAIQPYNHEWVGVYDIDGVYTHPSAEGVVDLPSRGVSFVTPPDGKCIQMWIGKAKTDKVCETKPYVNVAVTGISVVDPQTSCGVEGIAQFYHNGFKISVIVETDGTIITEPRIFSSVQVPEGHMMKVEDDEGRVYFVEQGTVSLYRYALSAVKHLTLVKGIHHHHPRIWDGVWEQSFAVGHYDIGSHVFHREKQWCHRLWVPTGYKLTVTRKGWWDSNTPRVHTYGPGEHDISYGFFFGIGDTPIESIDVVAV